MSLVIVGCFREEEMRLVGLQTWMKYAQHLFRVEARGLDEGGVGERKC